MDSVENHGLQSQDATIVVIDAKEEVDQNLNVSLAQKIESSLKTGEIDLENVFVPKVM
jgi:hypothetical protein